MRKCLSTEALPRSLKALAVAKHRLDKMTEKEKIIKELKKEYPQPVCSRQA